MHIFSQLHRPMSALICLVMVGLTVSLTSCKQGESSGEGASGQELLDAVKLGDDERVSFLLEEGVYMEVRDERGDTPLLYAVKTGNVGAAHMLLQQGADYETRCKNGKGPLELALDAGSEKMVTCLLQGGVSPDEIGGDKNPLLLKAVMLHDLAVMNLLLKNGVNPNAAGKDGRTALHMAAEQRSPECLEVLLKAGAEKELKDDLGATALWYTLGSETEKGRSESVCLDLLLKAGADASAMGIKKRPLLCEAVRRGSRNDVLKLIRYGADVNLAGEEDGMSPVAIAAVSGSASLLEMLLTSGADGGDLFYQAVAGEDMALIELLLISGLSIESWNGPEKDSLIAHSVRSGNLEMTELFLRYGADPMTKGLEGEYALHMAIAMREPHLVEALLRYGHDPNQYFTKPATKEFLALTEKESMRWFLGRERRLTPLMMAANNGDLEIIRTLMDYGAKKYVWSGRYRLYPLNFATRRSDVKAMQVILGQDPEKEKFHAVLDLSDQRVKLYDPKGKVIFSSRVSTGKAGYRTPTGTFVITDKHKRHNSSIYGSSMPYFQRFSSSAFGFHAGNCPGYPASHGCIRMPYSSAKKLFSITPVGTRVVIRK